MRNCEISPPTPLDFNKSKQEKTAISPTISKVKNMNKLLQVTIFLLFNYRGCQNKKKKISLFIAVHWWNKFLKQTKLYFFSQWKCQWSTLFCYLIILHKSVSCFMHLLQKTGLSIRVCTQRWRGETQFEYLISFTGIKILVRFQYLLETPTGHYFLTVPKINSSNINHLW